MTGGGLIASMLAAEGVDTVFGLPDGTYQALIGGLAMSLRRCTLPQPTHV
jgi:thiamine pyrophosphate-dependent acetolactate synthase large subunit-like protein